MLDRVDFEPVFFAPFVSSVMRVEHRRIEGWLDELKQSLAEHSRPQASTAMAELPGMKKEDIRVSIDGAQVTLSGEVKREKDVKDGERLIHTERVYGKVERSFTLPLELDEAKAEAKFADGVLELKLPKKAAAARKTVTIQ
jgi:HSP20 family molecular chaperone IbpA